MIVGLGGAPALVTVNGRRSGWANGDSLIIDSTVVPPPGG